MKKYITSGLLVVASLSFVYAQVTDTDTSSTNSCAIISQNLRYLSRDANGSTDVSILQDFLNGRGYLKSQPTGFFGSATRRAVIAFQNDNGLRATPPGYVGPGTRAKIQEIDCNDNSNTSVNTAPTTNTTPVTYTNAPTYTAPVTQPIYTTPAPQITSIDCKGSCSNLEMPISGQSIIHGNYFSGTPSVFLGGTQLQGVQVYNDNTLTLSIPTWIKPGSYNLYISNQNGTSNTVSVTVFAPVTSPVYTTPVPQITSIDCKGSCNNLDMPINGQSIIHGNYFSGTPSVFLGGTQLQGVQVYNDNTLTLSIPSSVKPGNYTLYVSNQNGTSNTVSVNIFVSITSPVINYFNINDAQQVAVSGSNFSTITLKAQCPNGIAMSVAGQWVTDTSRSLCNVEKPLYKNPGTNTVDTHMNNMDQFQNMIFLDEQGIAYLGGYTIKAETVVPVTLTACTAQGTCTQKTANLTVHPKG